MLINTNLISLLFHTETLCHSNLGGNFLEAKYVVQFSVAVVVFSFKVIYSIEAVLFPEVSSSPSSFFFFSF